MTRALNDRQIAALEAIRRASSGRLKRYHLADAIGAYATNTIQSLRDRGLIEWTSDGAGMAYKLTDAGAAAILEHRRAAS